MIALVDNRDSFTFNIAQELMALGAEVRVVRALEAAAEDILGLRPAGIVLGPGPGRPGGAGCTEELVRQSATGAAPPVLGICLGHQAIATALGGRLRTARTLVHGECREVSHDGRGVFEGETGPVDLARYNSLAVEADGLPAELEIAGTTADGDVAALRHRTRPLHGIQGHPESVLCLDAGRRLLGRFLRGLH